jgi:DNA-binding winged helix-turn-helix (wHTH) protein
MSADLSPPAAIDLAREADFALGGLAVRPSLREVEGEGGVQTLEPRVMQALVALARRSGQVVSRDTLIETCWDGRIVGDDAINRCMAKLRQVGQASGAFLLETVPRVGYRLVPSEAPAATAQRAGPRPWWIAAAVAVTLLLAAGVWLGWRGLGGTLTERTPVAVGAFRAVGADPAVRALATDLPGEVEGVFTELRIPTTRSAGFGRRLEVDGEVARDGDRLRTRIRLVEPRSGAVLWTADLSQPAADAARLREATVLRAAAAVQMAHEALRYRSPGFGLEELGLMVRASDSIQQGTWNVIDTLRELRRRAPRYAPGQAEFGEGLIAQATYATPAEGRELQRRGEAEIRAALKARPDYANGYALLANALPSRAWAEREQLFARAEQLRGGPAFPGSANLLLDTGRLNDGVLRLEQAVATREAWTGGAGALVLARHFAGFGSDQVMNVDRYLAMRPADTTLRRAKLMVIALTGDPAEALAFIADPAQRPVTLRPGGVRGFTAFVKARASGSPADRAAALSEIMTWGRTGELERGQAIPLLAALGATDAAFELAFLYADDPRVKVQTLMFEPRFLFGRETAAMRRDPRFATLMEKLGLTAYWRTTGRWPDFCRTEPQSVCAAIRAGR